MAERERTEFYVYWAILSSTERGEGFFLSTKCKNQPTAADVRFLWFV
jgi:hypothetical protein